MIKSRVDQPKREDFDIQPARQMRMGIQFATEAVAGPQASTLAIEQGITGSFKRQIRRKFKYFEAMLFKPSLEVLLFTLAFTMEETAQDKFLTDSDSRVRCKDHVRQPGLRRNFFNVGILLEKFVEALPLLDG